MAFGGEVVGLSSGAAGEFFDHLAVVANENGQACAFNLDDGKLVWKMSNVVKEHGVRAAVIRSVSDTASCSLPYDFDQARDARGQIRMGALLRQVIRQPQRLPALLRFARDCRFAARELADFLDHYLRLLSARLDLSQSEMVAAT